MPRKGQQTFYVHYDDFNKRLDEWVVGSRIDLTKEVEWSVPQEKDSKKTEPKKDKAPAKAPLKSTNSQAKATRPPRASGKENRESIAVISNEVVADGTSAPEDEDLDLEEVQDAAAAAKAAAPEIYSREEEIEKLRTGGSMTQNQTEINRVRNLTRIQMGEHEIEPWYFSPYPQEVTDADPLYICEFCLGFNASYKQFTRHRAKCTLLHPPGNEIYRDDNVSFFEIDGSRQITWCRNLCLLSKLFLDHKTLYYDVDPFLFYCMCTRNDQGCHLVGYFSKEKQSQDGYNVACILTLPQYQRKGFGRLLINFSYELSKRENKQGSPEKPLSDLGLLGYRAYWAEIVVEALVSHNEMSVESLATENAMTIEDVIHTLQNLNMLRFKGNQHVIVLTDAVLAQRERLKEKEAKRGGRQVIEAEKLIWKPYQVTAASRTWNW